MHEQIELQNIPVKGYRTSDRLMVAAPLPGLEPEDITVVVTNEGRLILDGKLRGILKDVKELLVDEWSVGGYHRELDLPRKPHRRCGASTVEIAEAIIRQAEKLG